MQIKHSAGLNEAFRYGYLMFALNNKLEPITGLLHCKDYFNDIISSETLKQEKAIYGFSWRPGTINLEDDLYIGVTSDDDKYPILAIKDIKLGLQNNLFYLFIGDYSRRIDSSYYQRSSEVNKTVIEYIFDVQEIEVNGRPSLIYKVPQLAKEYPVITSMFTLLIRVISTSIQNSTYTLSSNFDQDKGILRTAIERMRFLNRTYNVTRLNPLGMHSLLTYKEIDDIKKVHNEGISTFNFSIKQF